MDFEELSFSALGIIAIFAICYILKVTTSRTEYVPDSILEYMDDGYSVTYNDSYLGYDELSDLFENLEYNEMMFYIPDDGNHTLTLIPASTYLNDLLDKGYKVSIDNSVVDNAHGSIKELLGSKNFIGISDSNKLIHFETRRVTGYSTSYTPVILPRM